MSFSLHGNRRWILRPDRAAQRERLIGCHLFLMLAACWPILPIDFVMCNAQKENNDIHIFHVSCSLCQAGDWIQFRAELRGSTTKGTRTTGSEPLHMCICISFFHCPSRLSEQSHRCLPLKNTHLFLCYDGTVMNDAHEGQIDPFILNVIPAWVELYHASYMRTETNYATVLSG